MRVLVCAREAPLRPLNGFRLQLTQLCAELGRHHEVVVLAYVWPDQEGSPPSGVELVRVPLPEPTRVQAVAGRAHAALMREPAPAAAMTAPMAAAARRAVRDRAPDVVHVAGASLARISPALGTTPKVLASLDAWHLNRAAVTATKPLLARPLFRLEESAVRRFGSTAYRPYDAVVMVSDEDAAAARALDPALRVEVIPNGVDAEFFAPDPGTQREDGLIVLTGAMDWAPNIQAAEFLVREVLPRIREQCPDAHVALVGRGAGAPIRALDRVEGVQVTGEVPDVRPWLRRASAFACLMRSGTGIKNQLLEALACGTPSVATPLATQGMDLTDGDQVLVGEDPATCADQLVALLRDGALRERLGAGGRAFVLEHHSWKSAAEAHVRLYEEVAARRAA